ncbi:hypothetical protein SprV_0902655300 [Sparganum proliferum]
MDTRRYEDRNRRSKDTLKDSVRRLQIRPETWDDLAQSKVAWRREVKTGVVLYEANQIVTAKAKREAHKSQLSRLLIADHPPLPTCPHC